MKKPDFNVAMPKLQKEVPDIRVNASHIETDIFVYSIDEHNFRQAPLSQTEYITPELQSSVTENMSNILYNIQTIVHELNDAHTKKIEEDYKLTQCDLEQIIRRYDEELLKSQHEINKIQQSIVIYKNEITKLMHLIYDRNCLIEELTQENKELKKQQNNAGSQISAKILF